MVFQTLLPSFPWLTVLENTEFSEPLECNLDYENMTSAEVEERSGRADITARSHGAQRFPQCLPARTQRVA